MVLHCHKGCQRFPDGFTRSSWMHNTCTASGQGIPDNEQEICQSVEYGKLDWHQKENAGLQNASPLSVMLLKVCTAQCAD